MRGLMGRRRSGGSVVAGGRRFVVAVCGTGSLRWLCRSAGDNA